MAAIEGGASSDGGGRPLEEPPTGLRAGARLGPYEIVASLGKGGMGEVYRARDTRLGREVAIKVLPSALSADPDRLRRFEQEARAASALNHPNILTVHDVGTVGSIPYITTELVEGKTLRELMASGRLPAKKLLSVATQLAAGLSKAHAAGIVHRDLKPENVMVTADGAVKILDFGLAKHIKPPSEEAVDASVSTLSGETNPGTVLGTVGYMSPEQAAGRTVDFRSDHFSLGVILYEMVTGRRAFLRKSSAETLAAILRDEPPPIDESAPGAPGLQRIIERCLAKDPEDRYASTRDLLHDLEHAHDVQSGEVPPSGGEPWEVALVRGHGHARSRGRGRSGRALPINGDAGNPRLVTLDRRASL